MDEIRGDGREPAHGGRCAAAGGTEAERERTEREEGKRGRGAVVN